MLPHHIQSNSGSEEMMPQAYIAREIWAGLRHVIPLAWVRNEVWVNTIIAKNGQL